MTRQLTAYLLPLLILFAALGFSSVSQVSHAQVDVFEFETAEQERRFRQLSLEFRCPMCQNTNLADSPGGVAADLRRELYYLIIEGRTDEEIEQFMHQRYGDFIFYRPKLTSRTVLWWFGPALFFIIGALAIFGIVRRTRSVRTSEAELSKDEQLRLKKLLARSGSESSGRG
jgi:cytochrome c-type biogenesis protein CcmH